MVFKKVAVFSRSEYPDDLCVTRGHYIFRKPDGGMITIPYRLFDQKNIGHETRKMAIIIAQQQGLELVQINPEETALLFDPSMPDVNFVH